jgi:serine/threonine protein kinase
VTPGTRVGQYEILSALGAGGMGEVYRATDTVLKRQVALKVLPPEVANDPERVARFQREAEVLASLNHPNIAHLYGLERSGGALALVMELVEGPTLADRVARGAIPIDEALPIAKQIAEALEAAHDQGIIHRDLKPANIKVREDGTVKVLDFGLAKALDPTSGVGLPVSTLANSPTITSPALMTGVGVLLGTAGYMAPEQAKGRPADKRSDMWAFGAVLYEMLTGRRAFDADDVSDTLARVLMKDPDWAALPADTPQAVRKLLRRCLEKDRKRRLDSAAAGRLETEEALTAPSAAGGPSVSSAPSRSSAIVWKVATASLALLLLGAVAAAYMFRAATPVVTRFFVFPPEKTTFVISVSPATSAAISPDGRKLAFTARDEAGKTLLWVRSIDALTAQPLVGTDDATRPFWSPDNRFIAYFAQSKIMKVAASGGPPQTVVSQTVGARGGAWNRDGIIVFNNGPGQPLFRVSSAGGQPSPLTRQVTAGQAFPSFLPDGHHVLFYNLGTGNETSGIYVVSLDTGESKRLLGADSGAIFTPASGQLLFVRQGTLMAQPFNPKTLTLGDEPLPIAEHVESSTAPGEVAFSVSDSGVLAYGVGAGTSAAGLQMVWLDRQGKPLGTVGPSANYRGLDLAPDEQHVAVHRHDEGGGDIWITDTRGTTSRFTLDASDNSSPIWSPDGSRIVFGSLRNGKWGLYVKPSNMAGNEERLIESDQPIVPTSWSPNSDAIVYVMTDPKTGRDLWLLPLSGDRKPIALVHTTSTEDHGQISPDGKWLAYSSNETGQNEVYVQTFPTRAGWWPISTDGGYFPRWRGDGRELFYMDRTSGGNLIAVDVNAVGSVFVVGKPKVLFDSGYLNLAHPTPYHTYATSPDGQRFLIPRPPIKTADAGPSPIVVVLNWQEELKQRVPTR